MLANPETCWQPASSLYDAVTYSGTMDVTNEGFSCANWNDESVHEHKWFKDETHNFCRSEKVKKIPYKNFNFFPKLALIYMICLMYLT